MRSLLFATSEKNFEMKFEVGEETGSSDPEEDWLEKV